MLKILGVCGSPRRKSSYLALQTALSAAEESGGVETELVELRGRKIAPCIHCNKCLRDQNTHCSIYQDDMEELYDKVYACDGILISSPVYEMCITPQLSAFFSRFRPTWVMLQNDEYFFTRKAGSAMAVGGTRNGGQEGAINSIMGFYHTNGFTVCNGGAGIYAGVGLWNPGDGSGTIDDEYGFDKARSLGKKLAYTTKLLAENK